MLFNMNDILNYNEENMNRFLIDYRSTRSHLETAKIQSVRQNIYKTSISPVLCHKSSYTLQGRYYYKRGYNFIPIIIKNLITDDVFKKLLKINSIIEQHEIPLDEFIDIIKSKGSNKTFDLYFEGEKIFCKDINIIVRTKDCFTLVTKLSKPRDITTIVRSNIKDFYTSNSNKLVIPLADKNLFNSNNKLVFCNGSRIIDYSVITTANGLEIQFNTNYKTIEVCLISGIFKQMKIPNTDWVKIDNNINMTVSKDNILCFINGMLTDISIKVKSNKYIKIENFDKFEKDIIIFHNENATEYMTTNDNVCWYEKNISNLVEDELNNDTAPNFVKYFNNDTTDVVKICTNSTVGANKTYTNIIKDLIKNDPNEFNKYIDKYILTRDNFVSSYLYNMKSYDYISMTRNNSNDIPITKYHKNFSFPMVLFKVNNPDKKYIRVFVDGVLMFRNIDIITCFDDEYVYVRQNRISPTTIVEIELLDCPKINDKSFNAIINSDGVFSFPSHYTNNFDINHIHVFKVDGDRSIPVKILNYDKELNDITVDNKNQKGLYAININESFIISDYVVNSRKLESISFDLQKFKNVFISGDTISVYKNGKYIPRKYYTITLPDSTNNLIYPRISLQCKFFMSEHIAVVYSPYKVKDLYELDTLPKSVGKLILNQNDLGGYPINSSIENMYINGRKLSKYNITPYTCNAIELLGLLSDKHLTIQFKEDYEHYTNFPEFAESFATSTSLFNDYVHNTIPGVVINNLETDVIEKDYNIMRDLYWDLYNDYLKKNIVDFGEKIPDYIAIKYSDLIDLDNMIYIDCTEQMNHWMPLDATMTSEQNMENLLQLYDTLLKELMEMEKIEPYEMSKEQIERFKALTNKNVIVIDLSHRTNK